MGSIQETKIVSEILNMVDRLSEKDILEQLEMADPRLAKEIKRTFVFEDFFRLDDMAIKKVMKKLDSADLVKALKSVDDEARNKIFRNMSKRAAALLREDMEFTGPFRLKDLEQAQQKIVSVVLKLEDAGEITIPRAGEDRLAV